MFKKIISFTILFFLSFGSMQTFADYLYVTENNTKVFFNPKSSYKYIFWEWYKVKDTWNINWNFKEVNLTDWKKAYIKSHKLSSYIDEKYLLKSKTSNLLAEKFPLFLSPNAKWNVKKILYRWEKLTILNSNLINKVWVRVKDSSWNIGYVWYRALKFSNDSDNNKKYLTSSASSTSSLFFPIKDNVTKKTEEDPYAVDITEKIYKLRDNDYSSYIQFLENIDSLRNVDPKTYRKIKSRIKEKSIDVYMELENISNLNSNNQNNQNNQQNDIQNEIDELDSLSTEDLLNDLFK